MNETLYIMAPEAVMLLVQAAMTILELDHHKKQIDPNLGLSPEGQMKLAASIGEANNYIASMSKILQENQNEVVQQETGEESEAGGRVPENQGTMGQIITPSGLLVQPNNSLVSH